MWRDSAVLNINTHKSTAAAWRAHREVSADGSGMRQGWILTQVQTGSRVPTLALLVLSLDVSRIITSADTRQSLKQSTNKDLLQV